MANRTTTVAENPLCTRLQAKYSARIAEACNPAKATPAQNKTVSPKVQKVHSIATPFENTAEYEPARVYDSRKFAAKAQNSDYEVNTVRKEEVSKRRIAAFEKTTPFESGAFSAAYKRAENIRAKAYESKGTYRPQAKSVTKKTGMLDGILNYFKGLTHYDSSDERKVKSESASKGLIITIVLAAVIILLVILSLSQINSFKQEISALDNRRAELKDRIEQLYIDIGKKNDVKEIEKVATEDIGMVKSNQVESKYISVSSGDRVVLAGDEKGNKTDYGVFSTLMSAFSGRLDILRDYIG